MAKFQERRRVPCLRFARTLHGGAVGILNIYFLDLSIAGARTEHFEPYDPGFARTIELPPRIVRRVSLSSKRSPGSLAMRAARYLSASRLTSSLPSGALQRNGRNAVPCFEKDVNLQPASSAALVGLAEAHSRLRVTSGLWRLLRAGW